MDITLTDIFAKPFFQDLLTSFVTGPQCEAANIDFSSMTTSDVLNLLAPPAACDFAINEPAHGLNYNRSPNKRTSVRATGNRRTTDSLFGNVTRGRPKKGKAGGPSFVAATPRKSGGDRQVRDLVQQYGGLQKENLDLTQKILTLRREIIGECNGAVEERELDELIAIGRNNYQQGRSNNALKEAVVEMLIRKRFCILTAEEQDIVTIAEDLYV